jgi:hypothetical protein
MHAVRTHYLYDRLIEAGISCVAPSGAFYVYPNFNQWRVALVAQGIQTSEDLAFYLLERYALASLPGSAFGSPPEDLCLRLSSSYVDAGTDEKASALVEAYETDPDPERFIENHHPRLREAATRLAEFAADLDKAQQQNVQVIVPATPDPNPPEPE